MQQPVMPWRKALVTENQDNSFEAKIPIATKPSGDGVFNLLDEANGVHQGIFIPEKIIIIPYATNANNETFDIRLWGWNKYDVATPIWIPTILIGLNVVVGNINNDAILNNSFLADTLTLVEGIDANNVLSTGDADLPARAIVALEGVELIEFDFDVDAGGSASNSDNCLFRFIW